MFQEIYAEILQVETNNKLVFPQFFPKTEKNKRGERVLFQIQFSKRKMLLQTKLSPPLFSALHLVVMSFDKFYFIFIFIFEEISNPELIMWIGKENNLCAK